MLKILLGAAWLAACLTGCGPKETAPAAGDTNHAAQVPAPASASFNALKGKWARTDGDYVIEIREVAADGRMDAGYFNPGPIKVSKAVALQESAGTKVFIELQDTGYPGCTYSLTLDETTGQLHGQYFQAAMRQTYDVVFARLRTPDPDA
jgi:hypothetical protein